MMTLIRANGEPVPFGATASDAANPGENSFIVGDHGQVYLTGLAESGKLGVQWGKGGGSQCQVSYQLTRKHSQDITTNGIQIMNGRCL
jgi:outer membrane usher protein